MRIRIATVVLAVTAMALSGCGADPVEQDNATDTLTTHEAVDPTSTVASAGSESDLESSSTTGEGHEPNADDSDLVSAVEANKAAADQIVAGEQYDGANGVSLTVTDVRILPQSTWDGVAWAPTHSMMVRAENRSGEEIVAPAAVVYCTETPTGVLYPEGGWYAHSTYPMNETMPNETYAEGSLFVQLPNDEQGVYVPGCTEPFVEFSFFVGSLLEGESVVAVLSLPELP